MQQGPLPVNHPAFLGHIVAQGEQTVYLALLDFITPLLAPHPRQLVWLVLSARLVPILGPLAFLNACLVLLGLGAL